LIELRMEKGVITKNEFVAKWKKLDGEMEEQGTR
jgi:hypothetical protein